MRMATNSEHEHYRDAANEANRLGLCWQRPLIRVPVFPPIEVTPIPPETKIPVRMEDPAVITFRLAEIKPDHYAPKSQALSALIMDAPDVEGEIILETWPIRK